MYKCGLCGKVVPPGIKSVEVVVKKRRKEYEFRENANRPATWKQDRQDRMISSNDAGGIGWEASQTTKACPCCAKSMMAAEEVSAVAQTN